MLESLRLLYNLTKRDSTSIRVILKQTAYLEFLLLVTMARLVLTCHFQIAGYQECGAKGFNHEF